MNTNTITAQEFIKLLKDSDPDSTIFENRIIIEDDIDINQIENHYFPDIIISNIEFQGRVRFHNFELTRSIKFTNCQFNKWLTFAHLFNNKTDNKPSISVLFSNIRELTIQNCENVFGISINNNNKIIHCSLTDCIGIHYIHITGNEYFESLSVMELKDIDNIYLNDNKKIETYLTITTSTIKDVKICFCNFANLFEIKKVESNQIAIRNNTSDNKIKIWQINVLTLQIEDNKVKNQLEVICDTTTVIGNIVISGGDYGHGLQISGTTEVRSIGRILYTSSQKNIGPFYFNNLNLNTFILEGTVSNSSIVLNNIVLADLIIRNLFNYGVIAVSDVVCQVNGDNKLQIQNSSLGNFEIRSCDFSPFNNVEIVKSSLLTLKTIQTTWFDSNRLNKSHSTKEEYLKTKREVYRQLKQAMHNQGDNIQALNFQGMEMKAYKQELRGFFKNKGSWKHRPDWFIMFMNQSNNYGLNWFRPVCIAGVFTLVMYILLSSIFFRQLYSTIDNQYGLICNFMNYCYKHAYRFILLLDPTFKLKEVFNVDKNCELPFSMYLVGFIQRVGITYLIFQTVAAFRKYLK